MNDLFALVALALAGLAVGSFLNVCIHRMPRGRSVVAPASRCPVCAQPIRWYDNIPVVSFLLLRGRCRSCRAPISFVYPTVEIVTCALFLFHYWHFGLQPLLVPRLLLACALVVLFVVDLDHRVLPNVITMPGIVAGFVFSLFMPPGWTASAAGILIGGGVLLAVSEVYYRVRHEMGLGMGDVKMLAMIGAFLGWRLALLTLVISSLLGSLVGLGLIATRKGGMKDALPYGTFLAIAAVIADLAGEAIVDWYLSFY